jgi:hypothetical protein
MIIEKHFKDNCILRAMIPEFDKNGNLPPIGLIRPTIQEFEQRFVEANIEKFRGELYRGYKNYCSHLISRKMASIQWVDGSYTTTKPRPKDIDLVVHFDGMKLHSDANLQKDFKRLINEDDMKAEYNCHPQYVLVYPKYMIDLYNLYKKEYNHWLKWFLKDKKGNPKGLIEFNIVNDNFKSDGTDNGVVNHG